jgi:nitrogen regulatory protein PII
MKVTRIAAAAVAVLLLAGGAAGQMADKPLKPKEQAKAYEATLRGMIGQSLNKVVDVIDGWDFEALAAWEAVNPTAKEVAGRNRNKIRFSKQEYAEIFGPGGAFKVVVYNKLVKTETTTIGAVDSSGMGSGKDATLNVDKYTVIRVVFKDNALFVVTVWPTMDQGGMSGGTLYRR